MKDPADEGKKKKKKKAKHAKPENAAAVNTDKASEYADTRKAHPEWFKVRPVKEAISIRIDKDVLEAYRAIGKGYQSLMNNALRSYIDEHPEEFHGSNP